MSNNKKNFKHPFNKSFKNIPHLWIITDNIQIYRSLGDWGCTIKKSRMINYAINLSILTNNTSWKTSLIPLEIHTTNLDMIWNSSIYNGVSNRELHGFFGRKIKVIQLRFYFSEVQIILFCGSYVICLENSFCLKTTSNWHQFQFVILSPLEICRTNIKYGLL